MTYAEFISKAKNICIVIDDEAEVAYLLPDYRYLLHIADMKVEDIDDFPDVSMEVIGENLKLEVEAFNIRAVKKKRIIDAMNDVIDLVLNPIADGTTDTLFKDVIEYIRVKNDNKKISNQETYKVNNIIPFSDYVDIKKKDI